MIHCGVRHVGQTTDLALSPTPMTPVGHRSVNEPAGSHVFNVRSSCLEVPACPASPDCAGNKTSCRTKVARVTARQPQEVQGSATELVVPALIRFQDCIGCDRQVRLLPDDGCEAYALAAIDFFPEGTLITAPCPLNIDSIQGNSVKGGTTGAVMDITVPVKDHLGSVEHIQCQRAFVYTADVKGGLVAGYLFLKAYRLCVDPVADCLRDCQTQSVQVSSVEAVSVPAVDQTTGGEQRCACMTHSAFESVTDNDLEGILDTVLPLTRPGASPCDLAAKVLERLRTTQGSSFLYNSPFVFACMLAWRHVCSFLSLYGNTVSTELWGSIPRSGESSITRETYSLKMVTSGSCKCDGECQCVDRCIELRLRGAWAVPFHPDFPRPASPSCLNAGVCCPCTISANSRTTAASRENVSASLPPPDFVRRSQFDQSDCESDGISDLESESDDDTVHNSVTAEVD